MLDEHEPEPEQESVVAQFYGCIRQCGRPVRDQCSIELGWNPIINGFIQHTFKLNILFLISCVQLSNGWTMLCPTIQWSDSALSNCSMVGQSFVQQSNCWTVPSPMIRHNDDDTDDDDDANDDDDEVKSIVAKFCQL